MLIQLQLLSSIWRLFFASSALPLCSRRQQKQGEVCEVSPLLSVLSLEMCRWIVGFLHIYMCCGCDRLTQIMIEKSFLFSKIYPCG